MGAAGSHQSNVVRNSSMHGSQDIEAISGRMRRSTSCGGRVRRATISSDPLTIQAMGTGPPCVGSISPHDRQVKLMHETTDKKIEIVEGPSRQDTKLMHIICPDQMIVEFPKERDIVGMRRLSLDALLIRHDGARDNGDEMIVEFPKERRIHSTVHAKEQEAIRGNPIKAMLSQSLTSLDRKPRTDRGHPTRTMLSQSLTSLNQKPRTDATSCLEKRFENQQSKQHPHDSTREYHHGKHTHQIVDVLDWSSIDWGGVNVYWNYELNFYPGQIDLNCTRRQSLKE